MKSINMKQIDDKDREMVSLLRSLGMDRLAACTLTYLAGQPQATAREIEHGSGLRQPEVSKASKYLRKQGWMEESQVLGERGRPKKVYRLKVPMTEIANYLEGIEVRKAGRVRDAIDRAKA